MPAPSREWPPMTPEAEELYRRYARLPMAYARLWRGRVRDQDMHELESAGYRALASAAIRYVTDGRTRFSTFAIHGIRWKVHKAAIDCLRRGKPAASIEVCGPVFARRADHAQAVEDRDTIEDLLSEVPEADAALVVEHLTSPDSSDAIGARLGMTGAAVRSRVARARRAIVAYAQTKEERAC